MNWSWKYVKHLSSANLKYIRAHTLHPIVLNKAHLWYEVKNYINISDSLSQFSPIWGNVSFKPGSLDAGFQV